MELETNLKVPTLDQALKTIRRFNSIPVIEIKDNTIQPQHIADLLSVVELNGVADRTIFISFSEALINEVKRLKPSARVWLVTGNATREYIERCADSGYGLDADSWTGELVAYANHLGVEVAEWTIMSTPQYTTSSQNGVVYITTNAIEYCRNATPAYIGEFGFKAYSDYEKECIATGRIINRSMPGPNLAQTFDQSVNRFEEVWGELTRGLFPVVYKLNGATAINYDFEDTKYEGLLITLRFFNNQHQQLRDIGWLSHAAKTFTNIPDGASYFVVYCGAAASETLREYGRSLLNEMARSISLSYGGA